jgi:hypothetical protein
MIVVLNGISFNYAYGSQSVLTSYGPGVRLPLGARNLPLFHSVRTDTGSNPASYPVGTGSSSSVGKAAGA